MSPAAVVTPALLEAVRERARITDLFEAGALRRAGSEFVTRCPWHDDRRPSLTVSPKRNRVHCFVCGKGTDAIGWLQERQGLSFQEAVLELARRTGVTVAAGDAEAQERFEQQWRERRRLMAKRTEQRRQYHRALLEQLEQGGAAAHYLQSRGISEESARTWQLGFAAGRLVIPLTDATGQTLGFCGRALGDQQPKYRNSASDLLFQRNGVVFGLEQAAGAIRSQGTALLVEGPLDVIQLHQAGFGHAVACLGTSVSPVQWHLLQRHGATHLQLALDGDAAGQMATERLLEQRMPQLVAGAMGASVLPLPQGQDADGLIREQGASAMEGLIASGRHWLQWRLDRLLEPLGGAEAPVALELLQRVERDGLALLGQLPDGVLRQTAEQRLKQALAVAAGNGCAQAPAGRVAALAPPGQTARQRAEQRALRLYVHGPECRPLLAALVLQEPSCRVALEWLCNLTPLAADGALAALALELAAQLPDAIGMRLVQAAAPGPEVVAVLQKDAQAELAAVLDLLEPAAGQ